MIPENIDTKKFKVKRLETVSRRVFIERSESSTRFLTCLFRRQGDGFLHT